MSIKIAKSPSGRRLRALREYHGKTQLELELEASLGIGYLQRLESGKVQQPERETLERILLALNARFTERREILELFGYLAPTPLPTEAEIQWAIEVCQTELSSAVFPAYLLDCAHRLVYWNKLVPCIFQPQAEPISMLKMVFDAAYGLSAKIKNKEVFFPAQIRALRYEMQKFHEENWSQSLIEEMLTCADFKTYWQKEEAASIHIPARPLSPLEIEADDKQLLRFRLISENFVQDYRFRVMFYLPADAATIQYCLNCLAINEV